jgi:predicted esterase YcpF (UPF0227 family)
MATIIYLHGFASAGASPKSDALIDAFGKECVFAPDLPIDPAKTIDVVTNIVRKATSYPVIFIGTSLGGFWANYFSHKFDTPCILVNPSMDPGKKMSTRVGTTFKNYKTGEDVVVNAQHVAAFDRCRSEALELRNGTLINLFLAEDDDVIDYKDTCDQIPSFKSRTITKDGGHRYAEHWDQVINKAQELANK